MLVRGSAASALRRMGLDVDVADRLLKGLADTGVTVLENTSIDSFEDVPPNLEEPIQLSLKTSEGGTATPSGIDADIVLAATGYSPDIVSK